MKDQIVLSWKNNIKFKIAVILECLVLAALVIGCLRTGEKIAVYEGEGSAEVSVQGISLGPGVYQVTVEYQAREGTSSVISVTGQETGSRRLFANDISLPGELKGRQFPFWLTGSLQNIAVNIVPGEDSGLAVTGIWMEWTNAGSRIGLFLAAVLFLLIDWAWLYGSYLAGRPDGRRRGLTAIGLVAVAGLVSLPLMVDYCINGMDLIFHLIRIEGVKDALAGGQFPVRIQPNWLYGNGYATSIFYGDTFLTVPALLRMLGFSVQSAYKLFLLVLNGATALIAYVCFKGCFHDEYLGLIGSMLYTWSPYRIYDLYGRGALGETVGLCFLPILFYGFYRIFTEDIYGEDYRRLWILPAAGFTCIIQSHTLSCEMMGAMAVLLCVILWKKVFRRQTFAVLCKAAGAVVLLNAWFLVPFLSYLSQGGFQISQVGSQSMQYRGVYLAHYLFTFFRNGSSSHTNEMGMQQTESLGVGFAVTVCLFVYLWLLFTGRGRKKEEDRGLVFYGKVTAAVGAVFLVMSTNSFPWDWLQKQNRIFSFLIGSLQFPMRLLTVTTLCFTFVACVALWQVRKWEQPAFYRIFMASVIGTALVTTQYLMGDTLFTESPMQLYNAENMGSTYIIGGEYLPAGTNVRELGYGKYTAGSGVELMVTDGVEASYGKRNLNSSFRAVNQADQDSYVEVPLIYYKGYRARSQDGISLNVEMGDNGLVRVCLPAGFAGGVEVSFVSPWYFRAAEAVSAVSLLVFLAVWLMGRRGKKPGKEAADVESI